jgi:diguanylate cyclase (GGDEF)-like protein
VFDSALHPIGAEAPATDAGRPSARTRRWKLPPHDDPRADSAIRAFAGGGGLETEDSDDEERLVAPTTGFADRRVWKEAFRREQQRLARYDCPVTLVVAEIDGLDSLAAVIGLGAADRLLAPIEAVMRRNARATDVPTRTAHRRFAALLPETDEIAAINYVERVRSECDMWLETRGLAVRLAIGWAQPTVGGSLTDALRLAHERMNTDRHRKALSPPQATAMPLTDDDKSGPLRVDETIR